MSNTVSELALLFAALARHKDEDWIWQAMVDYPDLIGGFNRLDSTILKAGGGDVVAKEGADGLLGLAVVHPDYPDGLLRSSARSLPGQTSRTCITCAAPTASATACPEMTIELFVCTMLTPSSRAISGRTTRRRES